MATVIDSLLVTLGLDASDFTKNADAAEKAQKKLAAQAGASAKDTEKHEKKLAAAQAARAKELDARSKQVAQGISKIRNEAIGLLALFTAGVGIKNFVTNTIDGAAGLGFMSKNLSMSTEKLSAWQRAAQRAGGTSEGMAAQLKESASELAKFKMGMGVSDNIGWFFRLGGSASALKDGNTYLLARSKIVSELFKKDPSKAMQAAQNMGISDEQFNFIKQGPDAILKMVAAQEKNSAVSAKDAAAALELKNKMLDLRDRLDSTATAILLHLAPTFERLLSKLHELANWIALHKDDISRWIDKAVDSIVSFCKTADKAAQSVGGWKNVLIGLLALKVLSFAKDMMELAIAIKSVGGGLAVLGKYAWLIKGLAVLGLLTHSTGLNEGEDEELKRRRAGMPGYDKGGNPTGTGKSNPASGGKQVTGLSGATSATVEKRQAILRDKMKKAGYTDAQISGVIGSLMQESGGNLDPNAVNPKSGARGIAQWLSKDRVANFARLNGHDLSKSTYEEQVDFMIWELNNSEKSAGDKLRRSKTPAEAALIHSTKYERPGAAEAANERRQRLASDVHQRYGTAAATAAANMPTGAAVAAQSQNNVSNNNTNSTDVKVSQITVQTQATDASGIAKDIGGAVSQYLFAPQANTGLA